MVRRISEHYSVFRKKIISSPTRTSGAHDPCECECRCPCRSCNPGHGSTGNCDACLLKACSRFCDVEECDWCKEASVDEERAWGKEIGFCRSAKQIKLFGETTLAKGQNGALQVYEDWRCKSISIPSISKIDAILYQILSCSCAVCRCRNNKCGYLWRCDCVKCDKRKKLLAESVEALTEPEARVRRLPRGNCKL